MTNLLDSQKSNLKLPQLYFVHVYFMMMTLYAPYGSPMYVRLVLTHVYVIVMTFYPPYRVKVHYHGLVYVMLMESQGVVHYTIMYMCML